MVKGKGGDESTERVVYMMKSIEDWDQNIVNITGGSVQGGEVITTFNTEGAKW